MINNLELPLCKWDAREKSLLVRAVVLAKTDIGLYINNYLEDVSIRL